MVDVSVYQLGVCQPLLGDGVGKRPVEVGDPEVAGAAVAICLDLGPAVVWE